MIIEQENLVRGPDGIVYSNTGRIISAPLDTLLQLLLPQNINNLEKANIEKCVCFVYKLMIFIASFFFFLCKNLQEFIFSFLLSSRLFLHPYELLGKLISRVPENESLDTLVSFLAEWTNRFPYDFRDERIMNHVKHIVARYSSLSNQFNPSFFFNKKLKT